MTTRRTAKRRSGRRHINEAAINAWRACDYKGLHNALGLTPWQQSPLPETITALGVDPDNASTTGAELWDSSWSQAVELQKQLYKLAGPPDRDAVRKHYEKNLADAESYLNYCLNERRPRSTEWDKQDTARAEETVKWRRQLLEELT